MQVQYKQQRNYTKLFKTETAFILKPQNFASKAQAPSVEHTKTVKVQEKCGFNERLSAQQLRDG